MNEGLRLAAQFGCAFFIGLTAGDAAARQVPVAPYAKFTDGLVCKTKPEGWLRKVCEKQRDGLTSHPEALSYPFAQGKSDDILDAADPMATVRVSVLPIEWKWDGVKTPDLPDDVVLSPGKTKTLVLVPYASTCLRLTVFPMLEKK